MTTPSDSPSVLLDFSNQLWLPPHRLGQGHFWQYAKHTTKNVLSKVAMAIADTVERSARSVVAVNARRKRSLTGVYWRSGIIVTADHTVL